MFLYIKTILVLIFSATALAQTVCPLLLSGSLKNDSGLYRQFRADQKPRIIFIGENHLNPVNRNAAIFKSLIPDFGKNTHFLLEGGVNDIDDIADVAYNSSFSSWDDLLRVERARNILIRYYRALYQFVSVLVDQEKIFKMFHDAEIFDSLRVHPGYVEFFENKEILEKGLGNEWKDIVVERDDFLKLNLEKKILQVPRDELIVVISGKFHLSYYVPAYRYLEENNVPYVVYWLEEPARSLARDAANHDILTALKLIGKFSDEELSEFETKLNKAREILKALDWKIDLE